MVFIKYMGPIELEYTQRASDLEVGPKVLEYVKVDNYRFKVTLELLDCTLYEYIRDYQLTKEDIDNILQLFQTLLDHGIMYTDVHEENIMYKRTVEGNRWYIIDYGFQMVFPLEDFLYNPSKKKIVTENVVLPWRVDTHRIETIEDYINEVRYYFEQLVR